MDIIGLVLSNSPCMLYTMPIFPLCLVFKVFFMFLFKRHRFYISKFFVVKGVSVRLTACLKSPINSKLFDGEDNIGHVATL